MKSSASGIRRGSHIPARRTRRPSGSPPWTTKSSTTRWKTWPSKKPFPRQEHERVDGLRRPGRFEAEDDLTTRGLQRRRDLAVRGDVCLRLGRGEWSTCSARAGCRRTPWADCESLRSPRADRPRRPRKVPQRQDPHHQRLRRQERRAQPCATTRGGPLLLLGLAVWPLVVPFDASPVRHGAATLGRGRFQPGSGVSCSGSKPSKLSRHAGDRSEIRRHFGGGPLPDQGGRRSGHCDSGIGEEVVVVVRPWVRPPRTACPWPPRSTPTRHPGRWTCSSPRGSESRWRCSPWP